MIRIISMLIFALTANLCSAAGQPLELANDAPASYTVVSGDTLWEISGRFLKEPWRWPEVWKMNKTQIKNPQRIFPGDIIYIARNADGSPLLRLKANNKMRDNGRLQPKIYAETTDQPIPPIPPNQISPFLSEPLIIDEDALDQSAKIVAVPEDRIFLGNADKVYVDDADPQQKSWQIYRNGKPLLDPQDSKTVLGYEAFFLGTATQLKPGQPATFEIMSAKQEINRGDRLIPAILPDLISYIPHPPEHQVDGRVVGVYGGVASAGRHSIISINQGEAEGIELGHVLTLERNRVIFGRDEKDQKVEITVPPERVGLILVFRTFAHISYALVLQSEASVDTNDFVRTP